MCWKARWSRMTANMARAISSDFPQACGCSTARPGFQHVLFITNKKFEIWHEKPIA
jgi:hypothetical protein